MSGSQATIPDAERLRAKYLAERDKRLRADRDSQFQDATGAFGHFTDDPFVDAPDKRAAVEEDTDVLVVGAGFGGLLSAAKLAEREGLDFRIVEQAGDFGGTWYWNRYPGVRCDIESYIYMPLLEEVGTVPKERYATGAEIFAHCQAIGRHFGLYDRALFQTKLIRLEWQEDTARWRATTDRGDVIRARFVLVSQGPLAKVKLPGIPGIQDFGGTMFHSSRWDYDYTGGDSDGGLTKLAGQSVGVIGTGATSVQIVPKLAEHAEHVFVFQRTPSAIDERNNQPTDLDWFQSLPKGWQRRRMDNFLTVISGLPHEENMVGDRWTDFWTRFGGLMQERHATGSDQDPHEIMQGVDYQKMEELRGRVADIIRDPATAEAAKPWYNYLCKRPLYSDEFLQALNQDNVSLVDTEGLGVERITKDTVWANGEEFKLDGLIFATGFDVGAAAHEAGGYQVVGRDGETLGEAWRDRVRSVHGTQVSGFPNFHIVGGVAQGTTAFNFTHTLDIQAEHAVELLTLALENDRPLTEVTPDDEADWLAQLEAKHVDHQQFYEDCTPGFLNNEGNFKDKPTFIGATYGGGPLEYQTIIEGWREKRREAASA